MFYRCETPEFEHVIFSSTYVLFLMRVTNVDEKLEAKWQETFEETQELFIKTIRLLKTE